MHDINNAMYCYAKRMQELVNEAYEAGILLTTGEAGERYRELDVLEAEHRVMVTVAIQDHVHPVLTMPKAVTATCISTNEPQPYSILPSNDLRDPPPRKPTPAIPVFREETQWLFVDIDKIAPWVIDGEEDGFSTSAIKFGVKFDLLAVSATPVNPVTQNDHLDAGIFLHKVFYELPDGSVRYATVDQLPYAAAVATTSGDYRQQVIDFSSTPKVALLEPAGPVGENQVDIEIPTAAVRIHGSINLQFGVVELHAASSNSKALKPIGYTLKANRVRLTTKGLV